MVSPYSHVAASLHEDYVAAMRAQADKTRRGRWAHVIASTFRDRVGHRLFALGERWSITRPSTRLRDGPASSADARHHP